MSDFLASDLITPDAGEQPLLNLESVSILTAAPLTRLSFRGREASLAAAGEAFGVALPLAPLTASLAPKRAALWMGPDEWTLLAPEDDLDALTAAMAERLGDVPHALADISHRSQAIIVSGQKAVWLLNTGIFIDFSANAFPTGTVTRTLFHKAPVMVWRLGDDAFMIEAWGSFMEYVAGILVDTAQELAAA